MEARHLDKLAEELPPPKALRTADGVLVDVPVQFPQIIADKLFGRRAPLDHVVVDALAGDRYLFATTISRGRTKWTKRE